MDYQQKINCEIFYFTGYQLLHTIDKINLMVDDLDVTKCATKEIDEIIRRIDIYLNSPSHLIKNLIEAY